MESHMGTQAIQPLLRIFTFGALTLLGREEVTSESDSIRYMPLTTERLNGRGSSGAFALLKALLSQPQRSATRDQLMEWLSPTHPRSQAIKRLDDAASVLRCLLRPSRGENLLEYRQNSYHLAPYPLIWVDADAFHWYVEQACRAARFSDDALPLWEQAYRLASRGLFLVDDLYSEWASQRRNVLTDHYHQCVHELARLYRERGASAEAERVLREHVARDPRDEDGLRPLMELLGEQERYQEAAACYQRAKAALAEDGYEPDPRTTDIAEYLRTKEIRRSPKLPAHAVSVPGPAQPARAASNLSLVLAADGLSSAPFAILHGLVESEGMPEMPLISRRLLLKLGIAAFINRLAQLDREHISAIEREELGRALGESIADSWKLFHTAGNAEILSVGQAQLSLIHQAHALLAPTIRSYLYSGAYDLIGIAFHFQKRDEEALRLYHNGYLAAEATGDPWYISKNVVSQADTYQALNRYAEALQALEEAYERLGDIDEAHRRTKAHLLGCWADVAMTMGDHTLAQEKLDESVHYLDKTTLTEEFDYTSWLQVAGKIALMAGSYQQAIGYLEDALAANPPHWLVRQAGILTLLAIAHARHSERGQSFRIARQAASVLETLDAPMPNAYFLEYLQQDIMNRFPVDSEVRTFLAEMQKQLPQLGFCLDQVK